MRKTTKTDLCEKETKYCKIMKSVTVEDGGETFALERIYVKSLDREEIRLCLYKDCLDRPQKLIARPVDLSEEKLLELILKGIKSDVLDNSFRQALKKVVD